MVDGIQGCIEIADWIAVHTVVDKITLDNKNGGVK